MAKDDYVYGKSDFLLFKGPDGQHVGDFDALSGLKETHLRHFFPKVQKDGDSVLASWLAERAREEEARKAALKQAQHDLEAAKEDVRRAAAEFLRAATAVSQAEQRVWEQTILAMAEPKNKLNLMEFFGRDWKLHANKPLIEKLPLPGKKHPLKERDAYKEWLKSRFLQFPPLGRD